MIWIIGAGAIAREYAKVLKALGREYICIGRGEDTAKEFEEKTGVKALTGGLDKFLPSKPELPEAAIVAVNEKWHVETNIALMRYGVKRILCEKPGFFAPQELDAAEDVRKECNAEVYLAYNRRFFASTLAAEKIIEDDGGLLSFNFEFTEWAHLFDNMNVPREDLAYIFFANSTHVVDLAFFLGGEPVEMSCYGKDSNAWHKPINFSGAGVSGKGALFSYNANWNAPGRWAVELLTAKHRIYLKPMEQLQLQDKGSVKVYPVEIDDHLDKEYKPGFYLETKAFLEGDVARLCSMESQLRHVKDIYFKMAKK